MYQRVGKQAYKADLNNTLKLSAYLNNPERKFRSVHVAGTNGKGSTSHMMASVLQEAGYRVGLYTSPHLKDFRERIKIEGEMIPKQAVVDFVDEHRSFFEENQLSFFEMTVGLAFEHFATERVDIAVIEVGLGGRLDSTNIITPEVSVITNIGFDHMEFLGNTLADIAVEKAGIIKEGVPVVIGERHKETTEVFNRISKERIAELIFAEDTGPAPYKTDLLGSYQYANSRTAVVALNKLRVLGWNISEAHIANGLATVVPNTGLLGRWQILSEEPRTICDTAHNAEGLSIVLEQLQSEQFEQLHIVLGVVADKQLDKILPLFPVNANYYFCKPNIPRGLDAEILYQNASWHDLSGAVYGSVEIAFETARKKANKGDVIFVGGSTFTVAEVI